MSDPQLSAAYLDTVMVFDIGDLFGSQVLLSRRGELPNYSMSGYEAFPLLKSEFWVITANNPLSKIVPERENIVSNSSLYSDLMSYGFRPEPVLCRSFDASWSEDSFAVFKNGHLKAEAKEILIALAGKYEQNSIFHVFNGFLEIVPVLNRQIQGLTNIYVFENLGTLR